MTQKHSFCLKHWRPLYLVHCTSALLALASFRGRHYCDKWNATNPRWAWQGLKGQELRWCAGVRACVCARACGCQCVKVVSAVDNNTESSVQKTRSSGPFRSLANLCKCQNQSDQPSVCVCNCFMDSYAWLLMAGSHTGQEMWPCVHLERWTLETVSSLCTRSVPPPCVPLAHYQQCNSMFKGPPCLVVHIQSCRLKQIAICMPLGEKKAEGSTILHPISASSWIFLIWGSKCLLSPRLPLWPSKQVKVRAITAISASPCQADWEVAAKTKEWVSNHYDGVWFCGVSKRLLGPSVGRLE